MGSLHHASIPVVSKTPTTYRKRDVKVTSTLSTTDVVSTEVAYRDDIRRALGSGSIVRDDGSVSYRDELVSATYMMGRSADARIASADLTRTRVVELGDNQTDAVIPASLASGNAQEGVVQLGRKLHLSNSQTDAYSRVSNSGSF